MNSPALSGSSYFFEKKHLEVIALLDCTLPLYFQGIKKKKNYSENVLCSRINCDCTSINTGVLIEYSRSNKLLFWDTFSVTELREELFFEKLIIVYNGADPKSVNASAKIHRVMDLRA